MRIAGLVCIIFCFGTALADNASPTRRDLAIAYLRLDTALRQNPPGTGKLRQVHTTFDRAMMQVFSRDPAGAIETMNGLSQSLNPQVTFSLPERWTDEKTQTVHDRFLADLKSISFRPDLADAIKCCNARINLLTNRDADSDSNVFLNSPDVLSKEIETELASLKQGADPYRARFNLDFWRPVFAKKGVVPVRIFAPAPKQSDAPRALVIALHGAGGDENLFFAGYGAGLIKDLAIKNDFIVVSPNTFSFITVPDAFDAVVETMTRLYQIDTSRIYVVGHSLGAMTTAGLAARYPDRIRATVQIAGGGMAKGVRKLPPSLVILAELDPLFTLDRMKQTIDDARKTGLPIDYTVANDIGHAGAVDATLEQAIDFLLSH